jgi:formylglycine-generating enzyme required for sulfatase activity
MQGNISMTTVETMMPVFFSELLEDGGIDRSMAVARSAVQERPDFWMPALFLRLRRGCIWDESEGLIKGDEAKGPELFKNDKKEQPRFGRGYSYGLIAIALLAGLVTYCVKYQHPVPKPPITNKSTETQQQRTPTKDSDPPENLESEIKTSSTIEAQDTMTDPITGMEFVSVPGGCFEMGSPDSDKEREGDEGPVHKVCVDDFQMGKYEVTQGQWKKIMDSNPSEFQKGESYPVEKVSWDDAQKFIDKLNAKSGKSYRLPTEAEWEYACRANDSGKYCGGDDADALGWHKKNSGNRSTRPVGGKQANKFGLYDMSGNVWEWCADWSGENYYNSNPQDNPIRPSSGLHRVFRGGTWQHEPKVMRAANRGGAAPDARNDDLGFRLVLPGL